MRNLKTMGLALVAIFAMFAMSAAAAQADEADFWAEPGTVQIDVEADEHQVFTLPGKDVTCKILDGHAAYSEETDTLTGTEVGFTDCKTVILGFITLPTTVFPDEDCHFTFTAGTYDTENDDATGSVHICEVTVNQYTNSSHETLYCQEHVPEQTVNVTYTNAEREFPPEQFTDAVTGEIPAEEFVETTVTNLEKTGCNKHETVEAEYDGKFWAYGTDALGNVTDTEVTPTATE